jgi:hypothetical protein
MFRHATFRLVAQCLNQMRHRVVEQLSDMDSLWKKANLFLLQLTKQQDD